MVSPTGTRARSTPGPGASPPAGTGRNPSLRGRRTPLRAPAGAVTPRLMSRSGHPGSSQLQQLILIEAAAALLLAARAVGAPAPVPAAAVAAVLVLLAVVRRRGRPLPERLVAARALRARTRRAADVVLPPGTPAAFAPAVECDPALRTYGFGDRDQRPIGMLGDGGFLTVVLQVEPDGTAPRAERGGRPLPLSLVRDALAVDGIRLESAQILLHTRPAPAPRLPRQSLAVIDSAPPYAPPNPPAIRATWIALKLDPALCPEAVAARGGGLRGAQKCVARAGLHLASRLTAAGLRATVLTEEELADAVATAACAEPPVTALTGGATTGPSSPPVAGADAPRRTEESVHSWRRGHHRHTTYWVRRWPRIDAAAHGGGLPHLVARLTAVPALAASFSLTVTPGGARESAVSGHLRVTGRDEAELASARRALEQVARETGTVLRALDHEQLPGMLATLPLGGAR
ncbi:type VII secretion protein EccE [Streptomyces sp. NPDC048111]|uniref:type VII secretion protein EccE n=1 Tax=Streptomyces sp. NPDC048111 TaxID=3365500 RepID=UPI003718FBA8